MLFTKFNMQSLSKITRKLPKAKTVKISKNGYRFFLLSQMALFRDKKKHCVSSAIFWVQILAKRDLYVTQNSIPAYIFQNLAAAKVKILPKIEAFSTAECTPLWKLRGLQEITPRNPRILRLGLTGGGSDQLRIFSCCS